MKPTPPTTDEAPAAEPGVEPECTCDQLARAYAEDAAEHAQQEDEGR